jgi:hypothetical protein
VVQRTGPGELWRWIVLGQSLHDGDALSTDSTACGVSCAHPLVYYPRRKGRGPRPCVGYPQPVGHTVGRCQRTAGTARRSEAQCSPPTVGHSTSHHRAPCAGLGALAWRPRLTTSCRPLSVEPTTWRTCALPAPAVTTAPAQSWVTSWPAQRWVVRRWVAHPVNRGEPGVPVLRGGRRPAPCPAVVRLPWEDQGR